MKAYKNILGIFVSLSFISLGLVSCGKESEKVVLSMDKKPVLSIETPKDMSIELSKENLETRTINLKWTNADFGTPVGMIYSLNVKTIDSKKSEYITLTGKNMESISYKDFSKVVLEKMELPSGQTSELYLSVVSKPIRNGVSESDNNIMLSSDPIKVKVVIPQGLSLIPQGFSLVGSIFEGGKDWSIDYHGYKFFRDKESDNIHKYIGKFKAGSEFKIVPEEGFDGWNHLIGKKDGNLTWDGGDTNIKDIKSAGYYQLVFDAKAFTLDIQPYDASAKPRFDFIGIIGTAVGGWDSDILLQKAAYDEHIWIKENVSIKAGELKLRANKEWNTNWGVSTLTYGTAAQGAGNFEVTPDKVGTYNVYFNDITGWYIFEKVKK